MTLREWLKQPKSTQKSDRPHTTFLLSLVESFYFVIAALARAYLLHGCLTQTYWRPSDLNFYQAAIWYQSYSTCDRTGSE